MCSLRDFSRECFFFGAANVRGRGCKGTYASEKTPNLTTRHSPRGFAALVRGSAAGEIQLARRLVSVPSIVFEIVYCSLRFDI